MNKLKKVALAFLAFVVVSILFYLTGAFSSASLNISTWSPEGRGFCGFFGLMVSSVAFIIVYVNYDEL